MIIKNRKGLNSTKLCDVNGCHASAPTTIEMGFAHVTNPALLAWSSFWTNAKQLDFCPVHTPVIVDLLSSHANLCHDAMKRLAVMVGGAERGDTDSSTEVVPVKADFVGRNSR